MAARDQWSSRPVVDLIDPWIARAFRPTNLRATLQAMADAQHTDTDQYRIAVAHEKITTCDTKLDRYRAALEAGTDPTLVQQWTAQVQAEKATAQAELRQLTGRRTLTSEEINTVVEALAGIAAILRTADPIDKAEVYRQLGLKLSHTNQASGSSPQRPTQVDHVLACVRGPS